MMQARPTRPRPSVLATRPALLALLVAACATPAAPAAQAGRTTPPDEATKQVDPPTTAGASALNLVAAGGHALLTWIEPVAPGRHRVQLARWADDEWSTPVTITSGSKLVVDPSDVPSVVQTTDGALLAHWGERNGGGYDVILGRSSDGGATWTRLGSPHRRIAGSSAEHGFVSLLAESVPVLSVWLDGDAMAATGATELRSAQIWTRPSEERRLDDRVCDCCPTASAMTDRGPVVFYRDRSPDEVRDIAVVRREDGRWLPPALVARDGWSIKGCPVNGPAAAARGDQVAVAWYTEAQSKPRVQVAFSKDGGENFTAPVLVDAASRARSPLGRVGIALDEAGEALVTWVASARDEAVVLVRRISADGGLGQERAIGRGSATRAGGIPRIILAGDRILIAWIDAEEGQRRPRAVALPVRAIGATLTDPGPDVVRQLGRPGPGDLAPGYAVTTADGRRLELTALRGQVVVVNLWATWCAPCKEEMPRLVELHRRHGARGAVVLAVSVDTSDATDRVRAFVKARGLPFTIGLDPEDRASAVFGARSLPLTIVIDRRGVVRYRRDGVVTADDPQLERALEDALRSSD